MFLKGQISFGKNLSVFKTLIGACLLRVASKASAVFLYRGLDQR